MTDIHTPDERIAVEDLSAMVEVTLALIGGSACGMIAAADMVYPVRCR